MMSRNGGGNGNGHGHGNVNGNGNVNSIIKQQSGGRTVTFASGVGGVIGAEILKAQTQKVKKG